MPSRAALEWRVGSEGSNGTKTELETFLSGMEAVFAEVDELLASLSDEHAALKPGAGAWTVSECLDHLTMTARPYVPNLDRRLKAGAPRGPLRK